MVEFWDIIYYNEYSNAFACRKQKSRIRAWNYAECNEYTIF